ncbi:single-stranded-DNA-specific exonuclease RecJ [Desulfovibrio mangrovi]|uniref:single-stranded-DNA-specific exonuclease RecJ n=1 Tax=Desulfovibrio mangrovi TaxID=2976983 RepID=UPI002246EA48|nr:single-stranded-DNA-specific exonuclease RecJ [Desulfovibrio mangrovi]UZP67352.1 single-stranded-DNA-specific exonuclease RecJ [Desulfovibrio mangrovi]
MSKQWISRSADPAPQGLSAWAEQLEISDFLAELLWHRGLQSREDMQQYLSPFLRQLAPLCQWPGLEEAADVLAQGLAEGRQLAVWGDYDVDGVTSTALVKSFLAGHGIDALHHLPNRMTEGYGMNVAGVEALFERGVRMLLSVDCGISDFAPVARARELGMLVVVSDHHLPGEKLPDAHAICNPRLRECPCPALAGVGVAFFLMCALNARLEKQTGIRQDVRPLLDLVALGTIADVVDLAGQNRILVKNGLLVLAEGKRIGMAALKEVSGYAPGAAVGAGQVAFGLAPRINAAGRMGRAGLALDLLLSQDPEEARRLAASLDGMNEERKNEEERIQEAAFNQAESQLNRNALVLYGEDWHSGVIGIVASRVVEAHYRPTVILCREGDIIKGSARSVSEFHLHEGLTRCADLFIGFGGHKLAAGMSFAPDKLEAFRSRFTDIVEQSIGTQPLTAHLRVDGDMGFDLASDFTLLKELELLQPFGMGNSEPVFASPPLLVKSRRVFARKHLKLELFDGASGITLHAKAWRMAEAMPPMIEGRNIRLAFSPRIDRYNGGAEVDLRIKDWKLM